MSRFHSYLNSTIKILSEYEGNVPFSVFLKQFFSSYKKYGSRDRRLISDYCYQYFRTGKAFLNLTIEEKILAGVFLCSSEPTGMLETHRPDWNTTVDTIFSEKVNQMSLIEEDFLEELFPWEKELSGGIEFNTFVKSYFIKPEVFLRVRPGKKELVILKLKEHHDSFKELSEQILSVEANSKLDRILDVGKEVVIQDFSSQRTGDFLSQVLIEDGLKVWDCCAASGGKSILAYDINSTIRLTVSDIRESILHNLKGRFESAGIKDYVRHKVDLTQAQSLIPNAPFDVVIADVPCTGSGTWGRTPEQLLYFEKSKIIEYAQLQRTIVSNILPNLKEGGYLIYITCSVFKKENESNIEFLVSAYGLEEVSTDLLKGYNQRADSMFVSVLRKNY